MTITDLRSVANYHATQAANIRATVSALKTEPPSDLTARAVWHEYTAKQLTEFTDALEGAVDLISNLKIQ